MTVVYNPELDVIAIDHGLQKWFFSQPFGVMWLHEIDGDNKFYELCNEEAFQNDWVVIGEF